ncbi:MAG: hypothetical protein E7F64_07495 [Clostridiales bacterium]|nr:hypothetical protein [Clostridiales bacterium]
MVTFELKEIIGDKKVYSYFPEGDVNREGIVCVYANKDVEVIKQAPGDKAGIYSGHVFGQIFDGVDNGMAAWY